MGDALSRLCPSPDKSGEQCDSSYAHWAPLPNNPQTELYGSIHTSSITSCLTKYGIASSKVKMLQLTPFMHCQKHQVIYHRKLWCRLFCCNHGCTCLVDLGSPDITRLRHVDDEDVDVDQIQTMKTCLLDSVNIMDLRIGPTSCDITI